MALTFGVRDAPTEFLIDTVRESSLRGTVASLTADTLQLADGRQMPGEQVISVRQAGAPPRRPHDRAHVLLANGDCIPGRVVAIANDKARIATDLGGKLEISLPLTALSAILFSPRAAAWSAQPDGRREISSPRARDSVRLVNGDTIAGNLVALPEGGPLRLDRGGQAAEIPLERIDAILLDSQLARITRPKGIYRQIVLRNGARLTVTSVFGNGKTLTTKTVLGESIQIPTSELAALNTLGGPAVYLSEMKPLRYESTPYLGVAWPLMTDRSVRGNDLRLGGGCYEKGLGLHSACTATYAIPSGAIRFECIAGLDEETGKRGSIVLRIKTNSRTLVNDLELAGGDASRELRFPLTPADKELIIEVGFGRGGDVQDDIDLVDARFVVSPGGR
jgi:hypothetical protein